MATPPLDDDVLQETVGVYETCGRNITATAQALGRPRQTIQHRIKLAAARGMLGTSPVLPGYRITKTTAVTNEDGDVVREFVQQKPESGERFEIPDGHLIKGISALVDANGDTIQQWIKTRAEVVDIEKLIDVIKAEFEAYTGPAALVPEPEHPDQELATIYPIADLHAGLYAWGAETGEDYDLTIFEETNKKAFSRLVTQSPSSGTAVVLGLGDLLHADNMQNKTARSGNALDVDTRYAKVMQTAIRFMIFAIELVAQKHSKVIVRNLPGNHDDHSALAVSLALDAWFRANDRIDVDISPSRFWWWEFGRTLIGSTHGDMTKMQDLPLIMAASCKEAWGRTDFRLILTGHIHHRSAIETGGVIVESFQSPVARDAWHTAAGYRSGRSMSSITFHEKDGEISRQRVNII